MCEKNHGYILKRQMDVWKTTVYINRADGCVKNQYVY